MPAEVWIGVAGGLLAALLIGVLGGGVSAFRPLRRWPTGAGGVLFACVLFAYCNGGLSAAEHYRKGMAAQMMGNPEAALREYNAAGGYDDAHTRTVQLQQTVDHLRADYVQAQAAIKRHDWSEAETVLNPLAAQYPQFRDAAQLRDRVDREVTRQNLAAVTTVGASAISTPVPPPLANTTTAGTTTTAPADHGSNIGQAASPAPSPTVLAATAGPRDGTALATNPTAPPVDGTNSAGTPIGPASTPVPATAAIATPVRSPEPTTGTATSTPMPAATASATVPATAAEVLALLQQQGLPIASKSSDPAITDPDGLLGKPGRYTSKVNFSDARLPAVGAPLALANGGAIEVFASSADATRRLQELARINAVIPDAAEHDFAKGRAVLRLSARLTAAQAQSYGAALMGLPVQSQ